MRCTSLSSCRLGGNGRLAPDLDGKSEPHHIPRRKRDCKWPFDELRRTSGMGRHAVPGLDAEEGRAGLLPQRNVRQVVKAEMQRRAAFGCKCQAGSGAFRENQQPIADLK